VTSLRFGGPQRVGSDRNHPPLCFCLHSNTLPERPIPRRNRVSYVAGFNSILRRARCSAPSGRYPSPLPQREWDLSPKPAPGPASTAHRHGPPALAARGNSRSKGWQAAMAHFSGRLAELHREGPRGTDGAESKTGEDAQEAREVGALVGSAAAIKWLLEWALSQNPKPKGE
jgi:hypothetical protein